MNDEQLMLNAIADFIENAHDTYECIIMLRMAAKLISHVPSYERMEVLTEIFKGGNDNA